MKIFSKMLLIVVLILVGFSSNGCAALSLPFQAISTVLNLVGEAFKLAQSLPKPPPGVFF
ncbi:MAG: hypothetical protein GY858_04150 [Candidatus Omnitrophica bacterium]|nr:hypothetical protein [Candidatus Omnitrophota bacterium]